MYITTFNAYMALRYRSHQHDTVSRDLLLLYISTIIVICIGIYILASGPIIFYRVA